jgi:hypothetical protein
VSPRRSTPVTAVDGPARGPVPDVTIPLPDA